MKTLIKFFEIFNSFQCRLKEMIQSIKLVLGCDSKLENRVEKIEKLESSNFNLEILFKVRLKS